MLPPTSLGDRVRPFGFGIGDDEDNFAYSTTGTNNSRNMRLWVAFLLAVLGAVQVRAGMLSDSSLYYCKCECRVPRFSACLYSSIRGHWLSSLSQLWIRLRQTRISSPK